MTLFAQVLKGISSQARTLRRHSDSCTVSDRLSSLLQILMRSMAVGREGREKGDHDTAYHAADWRLARREEMLE
jgi:hypothetical protein